MNAPDDNQLPDSLANDLHGLLPRPPQAISAREREMLARAHVVLNRGSGRRLGAWFGGIAAAAALLIGVAVWQFSLPGRSPQVVGIQQAKPTIIEALRLARRQGARQMDIDQIAMAAVRLDQPEVQ